MTKTSLTNRSRALAAALLLVATGVAAPALAADPAAAQALFDDAKRLMNEQRWADACPKLEESERLDPGIGTRFQLAVCYEKVGKNASAWAAFLDVAASAKVAGQPDREKAARARAAALEPGLSRLVIITSMRNGARVPGLEVARDGAIVGSAQWGIAVPVDPGPHRIVATAPGRKKWQSTVTVSAAGTVARVEVPFLEEGDAPPASSPALPPPGVTASAPIETPTGDVGTDAHRGAGQRTAGVVVGIVGLAGLATGGVFVGLSKASNDSSSSHCTGNVCDETGVRRRDDARRYGDVATIALGAGGAAVITGVVMYLTAPSAPKSAATRRPVIAPMLGQGVTGLTVGGSY